MTPRPGSSITLAQSSSGRWPAPAYRRWYASYSSRASASARRVAPMSFSSWAAGSSGSQTGRRPARSRCSGVAMPRRTSSGICSPSSAANTSSPSSKWRTTRSGRLRAPRTTGSSSSARRRRSSAERAVRPLEPSRRPRRAAWRYSSIRPTIRVRRSSHDLASSPQTTNPWWASASPSARAGMRAASSLTARARGKPGRTYGTYTMLPSNSSVSRRSAVLSATLVRLIVATSWVCAITRCGSSACSGVSTLGAGPSASMQPAMNRIISASCIVSASRSRARRARSSRVKPSGPMVRRSVPLPLTSSAPSTLTEVLPPPGCTRRGSWPIRRESWTRESRSRARSVGGVIGSRCGRLVRRGRSGANRVHYHPERSEGDHTEPAPFAEFTLSAAKGSG